MQADVLIGSGRYVRDVASGHAQRLLPEPGGRFQDLIDWRRASGLPPFPAVAILTRSTDFDPGVAARLGGDVLVLAGARPAGRDGARAARCRTGAWTARGAIALWVLT